MAMKSKLPDRRKAAQAIEDMAADLQARGLALNAICPPVCPPVEDMWILEAVDEEGNALTFTEATLDECYLAAMNYPDTPPPF